MEIIQVLEKCTPGFFEFVPIVESIFLSARIHLLNYLPGKFMNFFMVFTDRFVALQPLEFLSLTIVSFSKSTSVRVGHFIRLHGDPPGENVIQFPAPGEVRGFNAGDIEFSIADFDLVQDRFQVLRHAPQFFRVF